MKNRFLGSGFVLTTSLGFGNLAFVQVDNIGDLLRVGVEDANLLVNVSAPGWYRIIGREFKIKRHLPGNAY